MDASICYFSDVKDLVLSGGAGTRLRPIAHASARQLVPVADKPVLFYRLEAIAAVTYLRQPAPLGLAHPVAIARDFWATTTS